MRKSIFSIAAQIALMQCSAYAYQPSQAQPARVAEPQFKRFDTEALKVAAGH